MVCVCVLFVALLQLLESSVLSLYILTVMITLVLNVHVYVNLNSFLQRNVYYVTQVLKQGINIISICPNNLIELKNPKSI